MHVLFPDSPIHSLVSERSCGSSNITSAASLDLEKVKADNVVKFGGKIPSPPISDASGDFIGEPFKENAGDLHVANFEEDGSVLRKEINQLFLSAGSAPSDYGVGNSTSYWSFEGEQAQSGSDVFVEPTMSRNLCTPEPANPAKFISATDVSILNLLQSSSAVTESVSTEAPLQTFGGELSTKSLGPVYGPIESAASEISPLPLGQKVDEILNLGKGRQRIIEEKQFLEGYLVRKQQAATFKRKDLATPEEVEKRHRNNLASARFRAKKKMREQILEKMCRDLASQSDVMSSEISFMRAEIKFLRGVIASQKQVNVESLYNTQNIPYRPYTSNFCSIMPL